MEPVLERLAPANELVEMLCAIVGDAAEQGVVVRTGNDRDGIDLDVAESFQGAQSAGPAAAERRRPSEALSVQSEAS